MSRNRVIGAGNRIPWHLPEDFRWFKQLTLGHTLIMGRKTFESIGRPLPGRETIVLTRGNFGIPGVTMAHSLEEIAAGLGSDQSRRLFLCGGAEIYAQGLKFCSELFLSTIHREVEGDAFFPSFENDFELVEVIREFPEFSITHHRHV